MSAETPDSEPSTSCAPRLVFAVPRRGTYVSVYYTDGQDRPVP
jgi:hypothetical protein